MDNEKEEVSKILHNLAKQSLKESNKCEKEAKNAQDCQAKIFLTRKKMYERETKTFLAYQKILEQKGKELDLKKIKQFLQTLSKANGEKSLLQISSTAQL